MKFENISVEEGLSQSAVLCISQDYLGFMWFGTQDGLNRYDGNKFTVYRNDPADKNSICYNHIRCIYEDKNLNLWVGTDKGLSRYNRENDTFKNYRSNPHDEKSLSNDQIRSICEDELGNLWIGTYEGGLDKYSAEENNFVNYRNDKNDPSSLSDNRINVIYPGAGNKLWIGTNGGGLNLFDTENKIFHRIILTEKFPENRPKDKINAICTDLKGNLYIGSNFGLFVRKESESDFTHFFRDNHDPASISDNLISCILEDSSGNIWVGTREYGLNLFNPGKNEFTHYKNEKNNSSSISYDSIYSLIEDRSGIIWVGTFGNGLDKFNIHKKRIRHYFCEEGNQNSLSSNIIYNLCEDKDGIIWIGTRDNGFNRFDRKKNEFTRYIYDADNPDSISDVTVNFILEGEDDNLWLSTNNGLNKFNRDTKKIKHFFNNSSDKKAIGLNTIFSMAKGTEGIIWLCTIGGGLIKFDTLKENFIAYRKDPENVFSIGSDRIRSIFIENEDTIWLGTMNEGLDRFDVREGKFYHYRNNPEDPSSISGDDILPVQMDSAGNIWVGTIGNGLNKLDKDRKSFQRYNVKDGLPNDTVIGILEDDSRYLWISTNYGLSRFDPVTETFKNYDARDGFQSNEYNQWSYLKLKSGELAFGGVNGFNIFSPGDITDNSFIPPVLITSFQIFNRPVLVSENGSVLKKSVTLENEITLSYKDSVFSFEFASLDFNIPTKNQYAYKMEGFDKDWVYSGNRRFVTYTNLNHGEYLFRVKGSNNDGIWNEEGVTLKIKITPPFWKTLWFKGIGVLAIAGAAGSIYQNKLQKIKKEKQAQTEFTKRLIDVQEKDRKRIANELHDSIGHELLITKNKLLLSINKPDDKEFIFNNIKEVSGIISDTINDIREISYTLHPYQIERLGLGKAIKSIIDRAAKSTEIAFTSHIDNIDKLLNPEVEISLFRIVQECITNIMKHSQAKEVILNVSKGPEEISIYISDNGIGFNPEQVAVNSARHGFGLKGIKERVKLFGGKFKVESSRDSGCIFNIIVPLRK